MRCVSGLQPYDQITKNFSSKIHSGWLNGRGLRDNDIGWNAIAGNPSSAYSETWAKEDSGGGRENKQSIGQNAAVPQNLSFKGSVRPGQRFRSMPPVTFPRLIDTE